MFICSYFYRFLSTNISSDICSTPHFCGIKAHSCTEVQEVVDNTCQLGTVNQTTCSMANRGLGAVLDGAWLCVCASNRGVMNVDRRADAAEAERATVAESWMHGNGRDRLR